MIEHNGQNLSIRSTGADNHPLRVPLRVVDLFAGAGGLALGFATARMACGCAPYHLVLAVEKDRDSCQTLRANRRFLEGAGSRFGVIEGDLILDAVHQMVIDAVGDEGVDVVIGGPPCQSYSQIGTRTGKWVGTERAKGDDRDVLFQEYVALVQRLEPTWLVLENVDGILTKKDADGQPYICVIIRVLEALGYTFTIAGTEQGFLRLNAADHGVPQLRNRVFIVGNRLGLPLRPPQPTHYGPMGCGCDPPVGRLPWVTVRDAIGDLPTLLAHYTRTHLSRDEWDQRRADNARRQNGVEEAPYHWERYHAHFAQATPSGQRFLSFVRPAEGVPLRYHQARDQQASDIQLFGLMPEGSTSKAIFSEDTGLAHLRRLIRYDMSSFRDKYRKQAWDAPCTTVFAHLDRDGNRFIHPDSGQARTLTVREAARLQSFPDEYVLCGKLKSRYRQIGNAVPPLLAMAVAGVIWDCIAGWAEPLHRCGG